jgi:hypothetical protein
MLARDRPPSARGPGSELACEGVDLALEAGGRCLPPSVDEIICRLVELESGGLAGLREVVEADRGADLPHPR